MQLRRIKEYYRGKPCKMDIGADGQIVWAVGRISGEGQGAIQSLDIYNRPSVVNWTTPHGSTFETTFNELYELDYGDIVSLKRWEKDAEEKIEKGIGFLWYGKRLNDVSHETMKLE